MFDKSTLVSDAWLIVSTMFFAEEDKLSASEIVKRTPPTGRYVGNPTSWQTHITALLTRLKFGVVEHDQCTHLWWLSKEAEQMSPARFREVFSQIDDLYRTYHP